jgi:Uma2 family endonuclease
MSTAATAPMTADEFWEFVHRPENAGRRWELENGEVREMPSPGLRHGVVCASLAHRLWNYVTGLGRGYVSSNDAGLIVRRDPDTVRGPDLMVFLEPRSFEDISPKFAEDVPALVVEVLAPSDQPTKLSRRIDQYRKRGVRLVWVVDPEERTVTVYKPGEFPTFLEEADELTGNSVLSEFRCTMADLFRLPGAPT